MRDIPSTLSDGIEVDIIPDCDIQTQRCRKLAYAVLLRAFEDYQQVRLGNRVRSLEVWLLNNELHRGSFSWYCEAVDLDIQTARKAIMDADLSKFTKLISPISNS